MNCKPGDMAMVVGGDHGSNIGKVVTCLRLVPASECQWHPRHGPIWVIDTELKANSIIGEVWVKQAPDKFLMPINPGNLHDEEEKVEELTT